MCVFFLDKWPMDWNGSLSQKSFLKCTLLHSFVFVLYLFLLVSIFFYVTFSAYLCHFVSNKSLYYILYKHEKQYRTF